MNDDQQGVGVVVALLTGILCGGGEETSTGVCVICGHVILYIIIYIVDIYYIIHWFYLMHIILYISY